MAKHTITAFYDSRDYANTAVLMLRQAGIAETDVRLSPESSDTSRYAETSGSEGKGFWATLEEMFGGSGDHETYTEGLRRGGIMVVAQVDDAKVDETVRILEQHGSVDLSERETAWRAEGWGVAPLASGAPLSGTRSSLGLGTTSTVGQVAVTDTAVGAPLDDRFVGKPAPALGTGTNEVLQVVEEQLNVGKRAVNRGKVRIHSYVVETPVSETVSLRDETVTIDRRPVDRALGAADLGADAFRDRTIEMDEIDEEAVVAKTARIVEEIGIRKEVTDRVQTINDTVRSTKVDVEDARATGRETGLAGRFVTAIRKDMDVVGSDGQHVGTVDHVDGTTIKLKRMDPAAGARHHLIPTDWIASVDSQVMLTMSAVEAKSRWTAA